MKKSRIGLSAVIIVLLILIACFGTLVTFFTDYLWFRELGYTTVFFKQLFTQLKLGIPTFLIITALTYFYLLALKKGYYKKVDVVDNPVPSEKTLNRISLGLSALFGIMVTFSTVTRLWFEILRFANSSDFNIADPIFNLDISFYLFKLEFLNQLNTILLGIVIAFFAVTLLYYFILISTRRPKIFDSGQTQQAEEFAYEDESGERHTGNFNSFGGAFGQMFGGMFGGGAGGIGGMGGGGGPRKPQTQLDTGNLKELLNIATNKIIILGVILFLMIGANFFLRQFQLLYSSTGVLYGAGYTDINVTLWVYRALIALAVIGAVTFAIGVKRRKLRMVLTVPVIMIIVSMAGTGAAMGVQSLIVSPDEINKETQYLRSNIDYTQKAYDLQDIQIKDFAATNDLTKDDIVNNMGTIANIRINDYEPTEKFYNQTQRIRPYYSFKDVDVDRYWINGEYTQVFLSARELNATQLEDQPWMSKHLKYTHGYGITLSRVDKITASGQPDVMIKNIPPVSDVEEITIDRPEIYFGEGKSDYIIVRTDEMEFDYPEGSDNVQSLYDKEDSTAGINLNLLNRALFAAKEQSLKILVSGNISSDSRIIVNRDIKKRVQKIAPFLDYDEDPYIVVADGKLYWIIDAYTESSYYPYSEPYTLSDGTINPQRTNYIRNSVKVVINAYNGETNYYLVDENDPIANTLKKIYPVLFKNFDEMPESLQSHIRYPNMLFEIQADIYQKYHMTNVNTFYQQEDLWNISSEIYGISEEVTMSPNYYIMKLPGEETEEFINSIPYTPATARNMISLLVARNDGEHYGELILYQLPKSRVIYGPMQVEAQIDQNPTISQDFSLWNSSGSNYTRGNMFVIPIEDSFVYVEPVYLEASTSSLPEVKKVIVYYNERIAYEDTLAKALDTMFGQGAGAPLVDGTVGGGVDDTGNEGTGSSEGGSAVLTTDQQIQRAVEAFNNAEAAMRSGDWAAYGNYLNELSDALNALSPGQASSVDMNIDMNTDMDADAGQETVDLTDE